MALDTICAHSSHKIFPFTAVTSETRSFVANCASTCPSCVVHSDADNTDGISFWLYFPSAAFFIDCMSVILKSESPISSGNHERSSNNSATLLKMCSRKLVRVLIFLVIIPVGLLSQVQQSLPLWPRFTVISSMMSHTLWPAMLVLSVVFLEPITQIWKWFHLVQTSKGHILQMNAVRLVRYINIGSCSLKHWNKSQNATRIWCDWRFFLLCCVQWF